MNSLLQLIELIEPEAYQHAIADMCRLWEATEPTPAEAYKLGFKDGFAGHDRDSELTWSLDYLAGFNDAVAESFLSNPEAQFPVNLNHSEYDEF